MSNQPERPWTEEEKYTLLTEILKKAGVPSMHLVKMIKDFRISPSWTDIPLPPGRSLNSCQLAFYGMCQQHVQPSMNIGPFQQPRPESSASPAPMLEGSSLRKRPLFPSEKPLLAPRAIQPRPPANATSFSSESGVSANLSSSFENVSRGEPPRKRGRPSKAETERRKAAAEARGETYPPPRRAGTGRLKFESNPGSPAGPDHPPRSFSPSTDVKPTEGPNPEVHHEPQGDRAPMSVVSNVDERSRNMPDHGTGPPARELPRPTDIRQMQMLPSPQALQLGPREMIPRIGTGERSFESFLSRGTSLTENNPRALASPTTRAPPQLSVRGPGVPSSDPAEKRPE